MPKVKFLHPRLLHKRELINFARRKFTASQKGGRHYVCTRVGTIRSEEHVRHEAHDATESACSAVYYLKN